MLWQRSVITLTLGPLSLFLIYLGGPYYFIPLMIIILIGAWEYAGIMEKLGWQVPVWLLLPAVLALLIHGQWPALDIFGGALTLALFLAMVYALWRYERQLSPLATADWVATFGGILLLGWLGSHFFFLRNLDEHGQWALLTILTIWFSEAFAYLLGRHFGRNKLVPRLSPKKSVEGYVAGIVTGTVCAGVMAFFLPEIPLLAGILLGLLLTAIGPVGDLGISLLKREAQVKDSGHLFPGHGGALDRLDALIWSVSISYYLITLFILS